MNGHLTFGVLYEWLNSVAGRYTVYTYCLISGVFAAIWTLTTVNFFKILLNWFNDWDLAWIQTAEEWYYTQIDVVGDNPAANNTTANNTSS